MRIHPWLAGVLCALLAGCQTPGPPTLVVGSEKPITVYVPVVQPCVDAADIEAIPGTAMPARTAGVDAKANGAAADATRYLELAKRQNDMLRSCSTLTKQP